MSNYQPTVRSNFFAAVDKWQISFVLSDLDNPHSTLYGSSSSSPTLISLSPPILQLLLGEPSLLGNPTISALTNPTTKLSPERSAPLVSLGLTPVFIRFLSSTDAATRQWAESCLALAGRRPVSLEDWSTTGIADAITRLYSGEAELDFEDKWSVVLKILRSRALGLETIRHGLLGSPTDDKGRSSKSVLKSLSVLLGDESSCEPSR